MKGLLFLTFLSIAAVAYAQQPGIKSFSSDTTDVLSYRFLPLQNDSFLKLKKPEIELEDKFYTILQAPNLDNRYTKSSLIIKRPDFIPEMPVAPAAPFDHFYLLDLDPVVVPVKDE